MQPDAIRGLLFMRPPGPVVAMVPPGATIGLYQANSQEAPTSSYARWFYENGHTIALPWFAARGAPMEFRRWDNPFLAGGFGPGPYSAEQLAGDTAAIVPDVVFVPLIGFTERGDRLGQGGGHYDRWLAEHPATLAIGLGWDCQLVDSLPLEPHDKPLAAVVTPTRLYQAKTDAK